MKTTGILICFTLILAACALQLLAADSNIATTTNTAIEPKSKIENDFYDWHKRHDAVLKTQKEMLSASKGPRSS